MEYFHSTASAGYLLHKICQNTFFFSLTHACPYKDRIYNSALIRENTGQKKSVFDIFQAAINIEVFQAGNVITRKPCVSFKNLLLIWGVFYYKKGRDLLRFTSISLIDTITIDHWSHYSWLMTQPLHVSTTKWHILHTVISAEMSFVENRQQQRHMKT